MTKISRILMPVDFSERCLGMAHYASALAAKYSAEIILLHVTNPVFITPDVGMAPPASVGVPAWLMQEKAKELEEFAAKEFAGLDVRRVVFEGIPEFQIAQVAKDEDVQVVIMPTHGYGRFRRFLIGSVTAKVLDDVNCSVFTGAHMEKHAHDRAVQFATVACAVNLKSGSDRTFLRAASFAHDFNGKLGVLHVQTGADDGRGALDELVNTQLEKNGIQFQPGQLSVGVRSGDIAGEICSFAESIGAELLVIGRDHSHAANGKPGGRLHEHTYSIIRQAPCPVLSI